MSNLSWPEEITPEMLLSAYALGIFPMAESREDPELHWIDPEYRGILPLEHFHVPQRLQQRIRRQDFSISFDCQFEAVVKECAAATPKRQETWINRPIFDLCLKLHAMGYAHSVEVLQDGALVGGLYGIALGGAFFGESMFSRQKDASKIALVYLVQRLKERGFTLLDTQFITPHLMQFGAIEISRDSYRHLLQEALKHETKF